MSSNLAELQAREVVKRMQMMKFRLNTFAAHAKTLRALSQGKAGLDDRMLLEEANQLTRELMATFKQYQSAQSRTGSIGRSLPSTSGAPISPWRFEMRAASVQFQQALREAETAVFALQKVTNDAMNNPLRTPTLPGDPGLDNIVDLVLGFADMLTKWIEKRRAAH